MVGILSLELSIPGSSSLKSKRRVIKSIIDRVRTKFNVSIAEVGNQELWQRCSLVVACVSNDGRHANSVLDSVVGYIEKCSEAELTGYSIEII